MTILMHIRIAAVIAYLLAPGSLAQAADPGVSESQPVDPADQREWLGFAWIDLRPFPEGDRRESAAAVVRAWLPAAWSAIAPMSPDDQTVISTAMDSAVAGSVAAIWLVPEVAGDDLRGRLTAKIYESNADKTVLTLKPRTDPESTPLHTRSPLLGTEGFKEWPAHRRAVRDERSIGSVVFEVAVNVDAVRHHRAAEFLAGAERARGAAVLTALHAGNARVLGMHARLLPPGLLATRDPSMPKRSDPAAAAYAGPPVLHLQASWSSRSEPAGTIRTRDLTARYWPMAQIGPPPDKSAGFAMAVRTAWRPALEAILDLYSASLPAVEGATFADARARWRSTHGPDLSSFIGGLEPWIAIDCGTALAGRGGLGWRVRLRADAPGQGAGELLDNLTNDVSEHVRAEGGTRTSRAAPRWSGLTLSWRVEADRPAHIRGSIVPTTGTDK